MQKPVEKCNYAPKEKCNLLPKKVQVSFSESAHLFSLTKPVVPVGAEEDLHICAGVDAGEGCCAGVQPPLAFRGDPHYPHAHQVQSNKRKAFVSAKQGCRKCCSAVALLRAEQGPCEPSKGFVSKFGEPERA